MQKTTTLSQYRLLSTLLFLIILLFRESGFASVFYVDNNTSAGCSNSTSAGTKAQPWCSIEYALKQMKGSDTLRIKQGTYSHTSTLNIPSTLSGTEKKPTLIEAFQNDTVIIRGPGVDGGRVAIIGVSWLIFKKLKVTQYNEGIWVKQLSSNVTLDSCEVYEVGQDAIAVKENSHHITIQNCKIHDTEKWDYNGEGVYIGTGSAGSIDTTNNIVVRNCTIYNTTDESIELKAGTFNCLVENNTCYNAISGSMYGAIEVNQHIIGVQTAPREPNHIIRNNRVFNITGAGIRAGTSCKVYNNVIYAVSSYGIIADNQSSDSWRRTIYHNTIDRPADSAVYISKCTTSVKNNIGPSITGNIEINHSWFVAATGSIRNYNLIPGSTPINFGADLRTIVPVDADSVARDDKPDIGAFEFGDEIPTSIKNKTPLVPANKSQISPKTVLLFSLTGGTIQGLRDSKRLVYSLNGKRVPSSGKTVSRLSNGIYIFSSQ